MTFCDCRGTAEQHFHPSNYFRRASFRRAFQRALLEDILLIRLLRSQFLFVHSFVSIFVFFICYSNNSMPNGTSNYFSDCNKATESNKVLGHLTRRGPYQLEPNVNSQSKTVLSVKLCGGYPKLLVACSASFCFQSSIKLLILGFNPKWKK